jgi:hypothetical protein
MMQQLRQIQTVSMTEVWIQRHNALYIYWTLETQVSLVWFGPLLADPVRTPWPVQPKKFGRWRKN